MEAGPTQSIAGLTRPITGQIEPIAGLIQPIAGPLRQGRLVLRYKRFLADVDLDGEVVTAHCPNSGSMLGMRDPGVEVLLSHDASPKRKLPWTWEFVRAGGDPGGPWVGCNTMRPNQVVGRLLDAGLVPGVEAGTVRREVALGAHSRIDFRVEPEESQTTQGIGPAAPHWVEVKNTTLAFDEGPLRVARFPDAVTERGARHMLALASRVRKGERATVVFFVNRADCDAFGVAQDIDPTYARAFRSARKAGVNMVALGMACGPDGWRLRGPLPVREPAR